MLRRAYPFPVAFVSQLHFIGSEGVRVLERSEEVRVLKRGSEIAGVRVLERE